MLIFINILIICGANVKALQLNQRKFVLCTQFGS